RLSQQLTSAEATVEKVWKLPARPAWLSRHDPDLRSMCRLRASTIRARSGKSRPRPRALAVVGSRGDGEQMRGAAPGAVLISVVPGTPCGTRVRGGRAPQVHD